MAVMELLQFHTLLYSTKEEVNAEYDAPAALPREQKPPLFVGYGARGGGGEQTALLEALEKGKVFISYRDS
jgi:hypothetical protein